MKSRVGGVLVVAALGLGAAACGSTLGANAPAHDVGHHQAAHHKAPTATTAGLPPSNTSEPPSTTSEPPSTTSEPPLTTPPPATTSPATTAPATTSPATTAPATTAPVPTGRHGPITEPPLPAPGAGFVADQVTAIGDSVMIDYEGALEADIPGVHVTARVSRWWTTGEAVLRGLESQDALGAVVIVGLGTNGPVSAAQFDSMMSVLTGASRVVFVNDRVDRTWQSSNDAVLAQGVARYQRAALVNWYSLAVQHPGWLYTTQTHLPVDGPGSRALAALVAAAC